EEEEDVAAANSDAGDEDEQVEDSDESPGYSLHLRVLLVCNIAFLDLSYVSYSVV
ncbi:hypothetical protein A2U01_0030132, partial [Trifolium medium]|nr:hypothetical protein [Trifolium medium]